MGECQRVGPNSDPRNTTAGDMVHRVPWEIRFADFCKRLQIASSVVITTGKAEGR